ncbi:ABC transporter permease [Halovivax gelatinilyticus]|uniref:ABC transporter permease n=1 Tax=Halovivax gelatinilyticus TaxID=2961597 RepID=UPI0020CA328D|nr:ABC transporter permease [Halovivax gelatinilyticus]
MSDHHLPTTPWTRQSWAFARRNIQQTLRNPVLVFLLVGWPILWYVLTVSLFVDDANGPVKAAMGMTFGLFGAFTVTVTIFAGEFARDLDGDRYLKLRAMAVSPTADLAGRFGSGIVLGVASYVVTVAAALIHGATFVDLDARAIAIVAFTLLVFCLIAMTLALLLAIAIPKPEYMTTISVVLVLLAFYVTGQNGVVPHMIAGDRPS